MANLKALILTLLFALIALLGMFCQGPVPLQQGDELFLPEKGLSGWTATTGPDFFNDTLSIVALIDGGAYPYFEKGFHSLTHAEYKADSLLDPTRKMVIEIMLWRLSHPDSALSLFDSSYHANMYYLKGYERSNVATDSFCSVMDTNYLLDAMIHYWNRKHVMQIQLRYYTSLPAAKVEMMKYLEFTHDRLLKLLLKGS